MGSLQSVSAALLKMVSTGVWPLITAVLPRALVGGVLGLVAGVVVIVVARRRGWLRRSPRVWSVLAKLHYPLCILAFMFAGCGVGAIAGVERQINVLVDAQVEPALAAWLPTLKRLLVEKLPEISPNRPMSAREAAQRLMQSLYSAPASDGAFDRAKSRAVNWVTLNFGKWVITAGVTAIAGYAVGRTGDTLGLTPDTVKFTASTIADMDLSRVDRNLAQVALDVLRRQLGGVFRTAYVHLALALALTMLLAAAEIVAYKLWWRRRQLVPGESRTSEAVG